MKKIKIILLALTILLGYSVSAQDYTVDTQKSTLKWEGKKVGGKHYGQISIKEGAFKIKDNKIASGTFVIDMNSITCDDLEGEWNGKLIGHLKSDDFFGVETYPVSTLKITESSSFAKGEAKVKGELTIKGKTHPIEFTATKSGKNYKATIPVDRTLYDVRYGSGKFFDNLGDKTIDDIFSMTVTLIPN